MYAWLVSPESLPGGYRRWITNASRVPAPVLPINLALHRKTQVPFDDVVRLANTRKITPRNKAALDRFLAEAQRTPYIAPQHAPCFMVHPFNDSCTNTQVVRFKDVFTWIFPVYTGLNVIPPLVLRRKMFMNASVESATALMVVGRAKSSRKPRSARSDPAPSSRRSSSSSRAASALNATSLSPSSTRAPCRRGSCASPSQRRPTGSSASSPA